MSIKKLFSVALPPCALVMLSLGACQTSIPQITTVDRILKAPNIDNAPYNIVLVVGAVPSRDMARNIETALTQHLSAAGVEAHSFVRESNSTEPTEAAIRELVEISGVAGVIVVAGKIVGAELETREDQVDVSQEARGGSLFNYFRYDYKEGQASSYSEYTVNLIFVSDFYDVASEQKIYSVESSTAHGQTGYDIIMAEGKAIVGRLQADGIIR